MGGKKQLKSIIVNFRLNMIIIAMPSYHRSYLDVFFPKQDQKSNLVEACQTVFFFLHMVYKWAKLFLVSENVFAFD